jgi:hypothetical protein
MTVLDTLIRRIDHEVAAEVEREKAAWVEATQANRERGPRLQRCEAVAKHIIELLKPRLTAFIERFKDVVDAKPSVREHTRSMTLTFAAAVAKVTLTFEVLPDRDVSHVRLECTQEIIPVVVRYDKQSVLEMDLDAVRDDAVVQLVGRADRGLREDVPGPRAPGRRPQGSPQRQARRGSRGEDSLPEVPRFIHSGARRPDLLLRR